jgi:hypothetical protein
MNTGHLNLDVGFSAEAIPGLRPTDSGLTTRDVTFDDPYDLYPVRQVFEQGLYEELAACKPGQPLVILIGEIHSMPIHYMAQIEALAAAVELRDEPGSQLETLILAEEKPYNKLQSKAKTHFQMHGIPSEIYYAEGLDPKGTAAMTAILAKNGFYDAPLSLERVFQSALRDQIATIFNDCAEYGPMIDPNDPLFDAVSNAINDRFPESERASLHSMLPYGMAIRNMAMVFRGMEALAKKSRDVNGTLTGYDSRPRASVNRQVIFQRCGANHVFGNRDVNYRFEHSLAAS